MSTEAAGAGAKVETDLSVNLGGAGARATITQPGYIERVREYAGPKLKEVRNGFWNTGGQLAVGLGGTITLHRLEKYLVESHGMKDSLRLSLAITVAVIGLQYLTLMGALDLSRLFGHENPIRAWMKGSPGTKGSAG